MCGSTVPNIDLLQSGQFNVIPWGDTPNILALVLPVEYWNTGHSAGVLEDILQYQHTPEEIGGVHREGPGDEAVGSREGC